MVRHKQQTSGSDNVPLEKERPVELEPAGEDNCRCKEVSKKTLPEMLKLMITDLAFWKKEEHKH